MAQNVFPDMQDVQAQQDGTHNRQMRMPPARHSLRPGPHPSVEIPLCFRGLSLGSKAAQYPSALEIKIRFKNGTCGVRRYDHKTILKMPGTE